MRRSQLDVLKHVGKGNCCCAWQLALELESSVRAMQERLRILRGHGYIDTDSYYDDGSKWYFLTRSGQKVLALECSSSRGRA